MGWVPSRAVDVALVGVVASIVFATTARGGPAEDCYLSEDSDRRVAGCTELIASGNETYDLSMPYMTRGAARSAKGNYDLAVRDFNRAIKLRPAFGMALNNRAWAYLRSGRAMKGLSDVATALKLQPASAETWDTRANIRQMLGLPEGALHDYDRAMVRGGKQIIKLYQCGLSEAHLYSGPLDGNWRLVLQRALEKCVRLKGCTPVPRNQRCPPDPPPI